MSGILLYNLLREYDFVKYEAFYDVTREVFDIESKCYHIYNDYEHFLESCEYDEERDEFYYIYTVFNPKLVLDERKHLFPITNQTILSKLILFN